MINKRFKEDIIKRLDEIEDRLSSDRRAVPVLKDMIKLLTKENSDLKDRIMARNFEEYKIYRTVENPPGGHFQTNPPEDLDDQFAGDILDVPNPNEMREP